jgi:hypothetical protein
MSRYKNFYNTNYTENNIWDATFIFGSTVDVVGINMIGMLLRQLSNQLQLLASLLSRFLTNSNTLLTNTFKEYTCTSTGSTFFRS